MNKKNLTIVKSVVFPIAGVLTLGAGVGIGVAVVPKSSNQHIIGGDTDIKIYGNDLYEYWNFTLDEELKDNQELVNDLPDDDTYYKFKSSEEGMSVNGKYVKIPVIRNTNVSTTRSTASYNIKFTCRDKTSQEEAWSKTVEACKITYIPMVEFASSQSKEQTCFSLSNNDKTMTFKLKFNLFSELGKLGTKDLKLNCWVTNASEIKTEQGIEITPTVSIDNLEVTLTLAATTQETTGIATGTTIKPVLQFECVYEDFTWWQSDKFKGFELSYMFSEVETDESDLDYVTETTSEGVEYRRITGLKSTANANANTLVIPARNTTTGVWYRVIGNGGQPLNHIANIKKIKFGGIGIQQIDSYAFYKGDGAAEDAKVSCLDLSAIPDKVQSLDLLTFGDNAFAGVATVGTIIWDNDISLYKKHTIKNKFYQAGITGPTWFGIKQVENISQLREYASTGGYIQLKNDIDLTSSVSDYSGQLNFTQNAILDLNGKTLSCSKPIYNIDKAEYAIVGVWDCDVVITDTSTTHNGCIKAYDFGNNKPENTDLPQSGESLQWAWNSSANKYFPRETRCFYVRSDIPTKDKGTLQILAGNFWGNCTCVYNYNTICYIEEYFEQNDHAFAPQFHIQTANFGTTPHVAISNPAVELLNCLESTFQSGQAYFDIYGGKFYGYDTSDKSGQVTGHQLFNPWESHGDTFWSTDKSDYRRPNYVDGHKWKLDSEGKIIENGWFKADGWTPDDHYVSEGKDEEFEDSYGKYKRVLYYYKPA